MLSRTLCGTYLCYLRERQEEKFGVCCYNANRVRKKAREIHRSQRREAMGRRSSLRDPAHVPGNVVDAEDKRACARKSRVAALGMTRASALRHVRRKRH